MNAPNHICKVCGRAYYACDVCDRRATWKSMCCSPEHYQVYLALIYSERGMESRDTVADMLTQLGVKRGELDEYTPDVRKMLNDILRVPKLSIKPVAQEPAPKVEMPKIEAAPVEKAEA